jgi:nucleoid-associated protein YgaU
MIKQNLGYIFSAIFIFISLILVISKLNENQKILHNTSSAKTVREESSKIISEKSIPEVTKSKVIKTHIVQSGDTLWEISLKYYGDGSKYFEIIKNNPNKTFKFKDGKNGLIYPGTELVI